MRLNGRVAAEILAPSAVDGAGSRVPVSMHVQGARLVVDVVHRNGDFQYPIELDPEVSDTLLTSTYESNWRSGTSHEFIFNLFESTGTLVDEGGSYVRGEWGAWAYETQGVSKIVNIETKTNSTDPGNDIENRVLIIGHSGTEAQAILPANYGTTQTIVNAAGSANNAAEFGQWATNPGGTFHTALSGASVLISQAAIPTVTPDTTDTTIEGRKNVAQTGGWLGTGPNSGYFGVLANDPGIGISEIRFRSPQVPGGEVIRSLRHVPQCHGVQCLQQEVEGVGAEWHYSGTQLPDGKDTLEVTALNAANGSATTSMEVKVDKSAPHDIVLSGLPGNSEMGDGLYKLKATATDGAGVVPQLRLDLAQADG